MLHRSYHGAYSPENISYLFQISQSMRCSQTMPSRLYYRQSIYEHRYRYSYILVQIQAQSPTVISSLEQTYITLTPGTMDKKGTILLSNNSNNNNNHFPLPSESFLATFRLLVCVSVGTFSGLIPFFFKRLVLTPFSHSVYMKITETKSLNCHHFENLKIHLWSAASMDHNAINNSATT